MMSFVPVAQLVVEGNTHSTGCYQCSGYYQLFGLELMLCSAYINQAVGQDSILGFHANSNKQAKYNGQNPSHILSDIYFFQFLITMLQNSLCPENSAIAVLSVRIHCAA